MSGDELSIKITAKDELTARAREAEKAMRDLAGQAIEASKHLDTREGREEYDKLTHRLEATHAKAKALRREAADLGKQIRDLGKQAKPAAAAVDEVAESAERAGREAGQAEGKVRGLDRSLDAARRSADRTSAAMRRVKDGAKNLGSTASTAAKFGIAGLAAGLATLGGVGIATAGQLEQSEIAFTNLLGSAERATKLIDDLAKMAADTPFELTQLTGASQKLLAFGFDAEGLIGTLKTIGDAASGTGSGAAGIDRMTLALGQMQAKGKISNEELMQLAELGIPVYDIMAEKLGMAKTEVSAFLAMPARTDKDGTKVAGGANQAFEMVGMDGLLEGIGAKYDGMMAQQSKSLFGLWSTLKDTFALGAAEALEPYMDGIKGAISATTDGMGKAFDLLGRTIDRVRPVVVAVFKFIGDNRDALTAAAVAVGVLTAAVMLFNAALALNPVGLVIIAIAAYVAVLVTAYKRVGWFRDGVQAAWRVVRSAAELFVAWFRESAWPIIRKVLGYVGGAFKTYLSLARVVWGAVLRVARDFVVWLAELAWPIVKRVLGLIGRQFEMVWAVAKAVWPRVRDAVNRFVEWIRDTGWPAIQRAGRLIGGAFSKIGDAVERVRDSLVNIWDGVASGAQTAFDGVKSAWNNTLAKLPGVPEMRFAGGPVAAGVPYIVGELGPEGYVAGSGRVEVVGASGPEQRVFGAPGTIIPAHLMPLLVPGGRGEAAGAGPGPVVNIGTINASADVDVEGAILHAQLRAQRIDRERR